ncbi:hypothetical protein BGW36DRAFT_369747 [Talaromyces proteolyticus]|uniref:RRM domain-containing protein n=1 Tax=Talaromyces proteolyticus TaxID=1131652 RepID=A0AAD4KZ45_9EURO|nr:uncharacterized protein BGW36DRAFT_369747 [Talaromyces proteolyticus]KAH8703672.1 hypothetical protein BGW36DRAFT_369747 [Talaromyces proteolyticus]
MAAGKKAAAPSFDSFIEAERLERRKKENQTLANELLGKKSRRASAPGPGIGSKKAPIERSLASRIGVVKRSASASSRPKSNPIAVARAAAASSRTARPSGARRTREDRMMADIDMGNDVQVNSFGKGISIKGTGSGPFVVLGRNFAPGTNAADIEAALEPVAGEIIGVNIKSYSPHVSAEIACAEKWGAEAIVAQFHGKKADGRVLSLEYKGIGSSSSFNSSTAPSNYDAFRERANRERVENRKGDLFQDGTFDNKGRFGRGRGRANGLNNRSQHQTSGLYSDKMMVDAPATQTSQRGRKFR